MKDHKCKEMEEAFMTDLWCVEKDEGAWWIVFEDQNNNIEETASITFCPWCGIKLGE